MSTSFASYCKKFFTQFFKNSTSNLMDEASSDCEVVEALREQYAFEAIETYFESRKYVYKYSDTHPSEILSSIPDLTRLYEAMTPYFGDDGDIDYVTLPDCRFTRYSEVMGLMFNWLFSNVGMPISRSSSEEMFWSILSDRKISSEMVNIVTGDAQDAECIDIFARMWNNNSENLREFLRGFPEFEGV